MRKIDEKQKHWFPFYLAFIALIALILLFNSCSVEKQISKECRLMIHVIDSAQGTIIICGACDSLKPALYKKINNKYGK